MSNKILSTESIVDLSRQSMAFWQTYVEPTKLTEMSFLASLFFGKPNWKFFKTHSRIDEIKVKENLDKIVKIKSESDCESLYELSGLMIPVEYGGAGLNKASSCKIVSKIAEEFPAFTLAFLSQAFVCPSMIEYAGTTQQIKKFLPEIASGRKKICYCISEPEAGSDAASITAKVIKHGEHFILNGKKSFIANCIDSDYLIIFVKGLGKDEEEKSRLTAVILPAGRKGIEISKVSLNESWEKSRIANVNFDAVKILPDDILGKPGNGYSVLQAGLTILRLTASAFVEGALQNVISELHSSLSSKIQFKKKLIEFEMVRERFSEIEQALYDIKSAVDFTASIADSDSDFSVEATACRLFCCERAKNALDNAMLLSGASALQKGTALDTVSGLFQSVRFISGSDDILRIFLSLMGGKNSAEFIINNRKARKGFSFIDSVVKSYWRRFRLAYLFPKVPTVKKDLRQAAKVASEIIGILSARINQIFEFYGTEDFYGENSNKHEYELKRLSDIAVEAYSLLAGIRFAEFNTNKNCDQIFIFSTLLTAERAWSKTSRLSSEIFMSAESVSNLLVDSYGSDQLP